MAERRQFEVNRYPRAFYVTAFIIVAIAAYVAGTYHTQILNSVATTLGAKPVETLDFSSVQTTYRQLAQNYDGKLDTKLLIEGASRGLVKAAGDDYTQYFNSEESKQFSDDLSGTVGGGIGVELGLRNERVTVNRVLADNPGAKAGLLAGDVVTKVNDESATTDWTVDDVVNRVRGEAGTTVKLTVLRGTETKEFSITRAEINNPSVYSSVENNIGILTISRFDDQTGSLARQAAQSFKDQNVKSVIVDLRGNGGGYITAAQDVAGIWLDKKVVVSERVNGKVEEELTSGSNPILAGIPTILLVNGSSASASEIVAGALQEYGAATLVGETTFGKGSVQKLVSLPEGAELKVTIASWYTPKGKNISKKGITPDTTVERSADDINANRDPQLDAAKQKLSQ
jgi:carboxyl-terminal processing protease